ncbi:MAG TPA: AMP-binding protein [Bryobacteraceae bacterium]|nr:AMP-binding protein [Bryobacteraceae bacterium]
MTAGIEADQLTKLRRLLAALSGANPFYSGKLRGIDPNVPSLDWYFQRVPFTLKRELVDDQRAHAPFGSNLTYPLERYTRFSQTNGTTGTPLRWVDTPDSWDWMVGNWTRVFQAAGVTAGDRIFFAFSFGPFLGFWVAFDAASRMGAMCIPGGGMRSEARLHAILDNQATVVCCTPTYAIRLGETAIEEHIDLSPAKVRKIIVAGEPGGSVRSTQARIEELWRGAHVVDHHGMTEVGPVSYGCPKRERVLHIIESSYIAEVIDPVNGQAADHGELVLTNLGRTGSPLLRYRTGDIVQRSGPGQCECGSWDLALEGGILARTDDMVVVRGVNLYPSAIEDILRGCDGVSEYRVEIRTNRALSELTIQVEPADDNDASLIHRLESALRNATSLRVPVSTVPRGTLPRFEMKAQRWIRL